MARRLASIEQQLGTAKNDEAGTDPARAGGDGEDD